MARMRTIDEAYEYLKAQDPETAMTRYYLRQLVINGTIPAVMAGRKYLLNLDKLEEYLSNPPERGQAASGYGTIRKVPERGW